MGFWELNNKTPSMAYLSCTPGALGHSTAIIGLHDAARAGLTGSSSKKLSGLHVRLI